MNVKSEYVRLSPVETNFGEKHLLNSQLELLKLIKSFHNYRVLRDEELVLKVTFKTYIDETLKEIAKLERLLPRVQYKEPKPVVEKSEEKKVEKKPEAPKKLTLEDEIAKIRAKLSKLQEDLE